MDKYIEVVCDTCLKSIGKITEVVVHPWGTQIRVGVDPSPAMALNLPVHNQCECDDGRWGDVQTSEKWQEAVDEAAEELVDDKMDDRCMVCNVCEERDTAIQKYEALLKAAAKTEEELAALKEDIKQRPFLI